MRDEASRQLAPSRKRWATVSVFRAGLGEKDQAFAYLEKEYAECAYYMNALRADPELDGLRADPRFEKLLRRMNLAE